MTFQIDLYSQILEKAKIPQIRFLDSFEKGPKKPSWNIYFFYVYYKTRFLWVYAQTWALY